MDARAASTTIVQASLPRANGAFFMISPGFCTRCYLPTQNLPRYGPRWVTPWNPLGTPLITPLRKLLFFNADKRHGMSRAISSGKKNNIRLSPAPTTTTRRPGETEPAPPITRTTRRAVERCGSGCNKNNLTRHAPPFDAFNNSNNMRSKHRIPGRDALTRLPTRTRAREAHLRQQQQQVEGRHIHDAVVVGLLF